MKIVGGKLMCIPEFWAIFCLSDVYAVARQYCFVWKEKGKWEREKVFQISSNDSSFFTFIFCLRNMYLIYSGNFPLNIASRMNVLSLDLEALNQSRIGSTFMQCTHIRAIILYSRIPRCLPNVGIFWSSIEQ